MHRGQRRANVNVQAWTIPWQKEMHTPEPLKGNYRGTAPVDAYSAVRAPQTFFPE